MEQGVASRADGVAQVGLRGLRRAGLRQAAGGLHQVARVHGASAPGSGVRGPGSGVGVPGIRADFHDRGSVPRVIDYVCYLHRRPRSCSGGDLLLPDGLVASTLTRIEPLDDSIVLFPSRCVHEVTVVECDPGGFGAGRFSVDGASCKRRTDGR